MNDNQPAYKAYLLRLWEENDHENGDDKVNAPVWRASLEDVSSHERRGFEGLSGLFAFLEKQTLSTAPARLVDSEQSTSKHPTFSEEEHDE